jgi:hypothetical protein
MLLQFHFELPIVDNSPPDNMALTSQKTEERNLNLTYVYFNFLYIEEEKPKDSELTYKMHG